MKGEQVDVDVDADACVPSEMNRQCDEERARTYKKGNRSCSVDESAMAMNRMVAMSRRCCKEGLSRMK